MDLDRLLVGLLGLGIAAFVAGSLLSLVSSLTGAAAVAVVALLVGAVFGAAAVGARAGLKADTTYW